MDKQYITPVYGLKEGADMGRELLAGKIKMLVKYRRRNWDVKELLDFLSKRTAILERNQCIPDAGCLFKGQEYLDNKYLGE